LQSFRTKVVSNKCPHFWDHISSQICVFRFRSTLIIILASTLINIFQGIFRFQDFKVSWFCSVEGFEDLRFKDFDILGTQSFRYREEWGKMKHGFYILMKRTLNLFLLKNNMGVSLCPRRFCVSYSPIRPYNAFFMLSKFQDYQDSRFQGFKKFLIIKVLRK
jgi:hypothetical protein